MIRTREEYLKALKAMKPNIYKNGEQITDVTTHSATRRTVESHARAFDAAHDEKYKDMFTTISSFTGKPILRFNSMMKTLDDIMKNALLKREMYRFSGTCAGGTCVGWNAQNVMWAVTHDIDKEFGTEYQKRLEKWILSAEERGILCSGALTDAKGNRSLKPHQQADLDVNLRIVERRADGIVVRGAKLMICAVAASEEIFVLPGGAYKDTDADFAVAFAVPRDVDGLTIVEARRPSDGREYENGWDIPETGITQSYLLFQDVFIPNERVFMAGEFKYSGKVIEYFTANYRACIGACVAGQGDVMIGASVLMARANGLSHKKFDDKLTTMAANNETTYGLGIGAMALGGAHPSGVWVSDSKIAHLNKIYVATLPYETKRLCQEIGGGIVETGCTPSYADFQDPKYGELLKKYVKAGDCSAESRVRAARLSEWLTIGAGVPGCMHGGGSPDGAKMVVKAFTPFDKFAEMAKMVAGITEDIKEPEMPKKP
ncbi:MAG: 4-hydroxyphenylacetate 3-hydroxylase [Bacteroidetes bacterium HGW-Bacteroidetes-21]|jgi:4-hydroxybutyryl-CoA dehydratase/vinylacetyl-CoA-Delta-isomerase|nr:MAG: 4-hydroxyphenylacetate 3-hydroxylase [Bacteroidetes bacterium HGW-Bacteroidetes-21]